MLGNEFLEGGSAGIGEGCWKCHELLALGCSVEDILDVFPKNNKLNMLPHI